MDDTAIEAIVKAVRRGPETHNLSKLAQFASVPEGYTLESLEKFRLEPERVKQRVTLLTAADFVSYHARFRTADTVIFGDERAARYTCIIDYHQADGVPHWCGHSAVYECPKSKEWETWIGSSGRRMTQAGFAEFIEDNYPDITKPSHAEMIQISTGLQAKKSVAFSQATRLGDGQCQLMYTEEIKGSVESKGGSMKVPEGFSLKLAPFLGGQTFPLEARLRYRIDEGKLSIWYDLHRHHKVFEAATSAVTVWIKKGVGEAPMFLGAAS